MSFPAPSPGGRVAAVILAAGRSSRMPGRSKLLRPFRGQPVVRVVVGTAREAGLGPLVVCVPSVEGPIVEALRGLSVRPVAVPGVAGPPVRSVAAGLAALEDDDVGAAMVLLGDEPGLAPGDVRAVRAAWASGSGHLLRPRFRDRPGHPVLVDRSLFDRVTELALSPQAGRGLWELLTRTGIRGTHVTVDRSAPIDVDTPAALRAARARGRTT